MFPREWQSGMFDFWIIGKLKIVESEMERPRHISAGSLRAEMDWQWLFPIWEPYSFNILEMKKIRALGVAVICDSVAVLGFYPLNDRLISIRLQGRPVNTTILKQLRTWNNIISLKYLEITERWVDNMEHVIHQKIESTHNYVIKLQYTKIT